MFNKHKEVKKTNVKISGLLSILIIISLAMLSCGSRKNKLDTSNIIPENDLISILTDIYITNGILTLPDIRSYYIARDSSSAYRDVIEKHGYSQEIMDKTMRYYFIKNPKKLIKLYDQVLGRLSAMESRYEKEVLVLQNRAANLYPGKDSYSFPDPGFDSTEFQTNLGLSGTYTLGYTLTLFPDDQSFNPRLTLYTCDPDSANTGRKHFIPALDYLKDGQPHEYVIFINAPDRTHFHLGVNLFDFDNNPRAARHVTIEKISLTHNPGSQ